MRRLLAALCGTLAVAAMNLSLAQAGEPVARATAYCADEDLTPAGDNLDRVERAVLCVMNRARVGAGLAPLARSWRLDRSARFHTVDMVRSHFLGHEAPGHPALLTRIRGYGYFNGATTGFYAENVGAGPGSNGTAHVLMDAWMDSPAHRANLLYPGFRDVGIAAVLAPPDRAFFADYASTVYTTDFGRRYVRQVCIRRSPSRAPSTAPASPRRSYCRPRR